MSAPTSETVSRTMVNIAETWKLIERQRPNISEFRAGMQTAYGTVLASLLDGTEVGINAAHVASALREEIIEEDKADA